MSADDRREALVEAAIKVMTRQGVAKATTRSIATQAEMPLGIFHYAFRSKKELMAMVTETIARQSKAEIDAAVFSGEQTDIVEVVRAGMNAYLDHVVSHPLEHLVTYELTTAALRDIELEELGKAQYDYYLEQNEQLLQAGAELVGVEFVQPISVVSRLLFSLMDGLALNWLAKGDEEEARKVIDAAAQVLVALARPVGGD